MGKGAGAGKGQGTGHRSRGRGRMAGHWVLRYARKAGHFKEKLILVLWI